jgi:hypothetical protein
LRLDVQIAQQQIQRMRTNQKHISTRNAAATKLVPSSFRGIARFRVIFTGLLFAVLTSFCFAGDGSNTNVYGQRLTVKRATAIKSITADPEKYVGKKVLVSGKVARVCKGRGCWVEVANPDGDSIICKSLDESVMVPTDCEGRFIQVQGKVKIDKQASGKFEMKKHEGLAEHACPAPKVLVSLDGASFLNEAPSANK